MGRPKGSLPFGSETMLERVARLVGQAASPVVIVAAFGDTLSAPANVLLTHDRRPGCGPLEGLAVGLARMAPHASAAFVTTCDAALLAPAIIGRLAALLGNREAVVPVEDGRLHPLAAVYRTSVHAKATELLEANERRMSALVERLDALQVNVEELRDLDPDLETFRSMNEPHEYFAALAKAGLAPDPKLIVELRVE
jgi:molybdopterin-guanine dinucleotide biosynthesis protein A